MQSVKSARLSAVAAIVAANYCDPNPEIPLDAIRPGDVFNPGPKWYVAQERNGVVWFSDSPDIDEETEAESLPDDAGAWQSLVLVAELVSLRGGGTAMGPHDRYPDGWRVLARRTLPGGYTPDPCSPCYEFYQSGSFINVVATPPLFLRRCGV